MIDYGDTSYRDVKELENISNKFDKITLVKNSILRVTIITFHKGENAKSYAVINNGGSFTEIIRRALIKLGVNNG